LYAFYFAGHDPFNIKVLEKLFTGSLSGRLIGPKAGNDTIKYTPGDCARACADLPTTKCMSFNYDFGGAVCELMEAIEGLIIKLFNQVPVSGAVVCNIKLTM
jgi:hypothetical protein